MWTFTMDANTHLTIRKNRTIVFDGSYEAYCAQDEVTPDYATCERIHERYELLTEPNAIRCADCGRKGHTRGHMECPSPQ